MQNARVTVDRTIDLTDAALDPGSSTAGETHRDADEPDAVAGLRRGGLVALSRDECLARLRTLPVRVGRVGVVVDGRPLVLPVNYVVDGDDVVFRTAPGTKLDAAVRGAPVCFEADLVDAAWEEGWSVLVQGRAEQVTDPERLARLRARPLRPWAAPESRRSYVRVAAEAVTGRRIA